MRVDDDVFGVLLNFFFQNASLGVNGGWVPRQEDQTVGAALRVCGLARNRATVCEGAKSSSGL